MNYIESGKKEGAKLVCGGNKIDRDGYFVETTIFADVTNDMTIAKEEIFGPVMSIIKFSDVDEAVKLANDSKYGLAAGVITKDLNTAINVSNKLQAGIVWVNTWISMNPSTPFGGFKESGMGREQGEKSLDGYLESKTIVIKHE